MYADGPGNPCLTKISEIPEQSNRIQSGLADLEANIERLERRLEAVLRPAPQPCETVSKMAPCASTPLGQQLQMHDVKVLRLAIYLSDIIDRVEV